MRQKYAKDGGCCPRKEYCAETEGPEMTKRVEANRSESKRSESRMSTFVCFASLRFAFFFSSIFDSSVAILASLRVWQFH